MMLQGRYHEDTPLKTQAGPLYKLLGQPKKIEIYDGGHVTPVEVTLPSVTKFLEQYLGFDVAETLKANSETAPCRLMFGSLCVVVF